MKNTAEITQHRGLQVSDETAHFTTVGAGRAAAPVTLEPGTSWLGEFSLRKFYHYWPSNEWQTDGGPPPDKERVAPAPQFYDSDLDGSDLEEDSDWSEDEEEAGEE